MLGKSSGVAKQLQVLQPLVPETHCHTHSLSLSVKDTTKNVDIMKETIGGSWRHNHAIKYSPKKDKMLGYLKLLVKCSADEGSKPN